MSVKARWLLLLAMALGARAASAEDAPKKYPVTIQGHPATVWASSTLAGPPGDPDRYCAKNAFDGDLKTAWVEGSPGGGPGAKLHVDFSEPQTIHGFALYPGYLRSFTTLSENMIPSEVTISSGPPRGTFRVLYAWQLAPGAKDHAQLPISLRNSKSNFGARVAIFSKPLATKRFELNLEETMVHEGQQFEDAAISEWAPIFTESADWTADSALRRATEFLGIIARGESIDSKEWMSDTATIADPTRPQIDDTDDTRASLLKARLHSTNASEKLQRFVDGTRDIFLSAKFGNEPTLYSAVWEDGGRTYVAAMPIRIVVSKGVTFGVAPYFVFNNAGLITKAGFRTTTGKSIFDYDDPKADALPDLSGL